MERRLIVLRHAKSLWPDGVADHERPLAERGRREAPVAGRWLRDQVGRIDLTVCSSATRARQTWELVAAELDTAPEVRVEDRLYDASTRDLLAVARQLPPTAESVLFVGHNPGLEDLVGELTGTWRPMKTGSIAVLTGVGGWLDARPRWAVLLAFATPRP
jgi:phosphohistidine phosphatase